MSSGSMCVLMPDERAWGELTDPILAGNDGQQQNIESSPAAPEQTDTVQNMPVSAGAVHAGQTDNNKTLTTEDIKLRASLATMNINHKKYQADGSISPFRKVLENQIYSYHCYVNRSAIKQFGL